MSLMKRPGLGGGTAAAAFGLGSEPPSRDCASVRCMAIAGGAAAVELCTVFCTAACVVVGLEADAAVAASANGLLSALGRAALGVGLLLASSACLLSATAASAAAAAALRKRGLVMREWSGVPSAPLSRVLAASSTRERPISTGALRSPAVDCEPLAAGLAVLRRGDWERDPHRVPCPSATLDSALPEETRTPSERLRDRRNTI
mmetsp:Transcript_33027/g.72586  ORF Transcript_33027/g.72586 Transcript_33027/m.72586 type:complete len:204 (-) Transcript_33027:407-1018(-)